MSGTFEQFEQEAKQYKIILENYKKNGVVFKDPNFPETKDSWKRLPEVYKAPLFQEDLIHPDYIIQGGLGDCYLIVALQRIASQPYLVKRLFDTETSADVLGEEVNDSINMDCGAVVVILRAFGTYTHVLIDTLIPYSFGAADYVHPKQDDYSPWMCLVEKAYAKLHGSYQAIIGGLMNTAIYHFFNYFPVVKTLDDLKKAEKSKKMKPFERLLKYQSQGCVMSASINTKALGISKDQLESRGLVSGHAYLILKARKTSSNQELVCLRNPWGNHEWNGDFSDNSELWDTMLRQSLNLKIEDDGNFWMNSNDFMNYYTQLSLSKPIPPDFHCKKYSIQLKPGAGDGKSNSDYRTLKNHVSYAFKLSDDSPVKSATFHIVYEKVPECANFREYERYETSYTLSFLKPGFIYSISTTVDISHHKFKGEKGQPVQIVFNRNTACPLTENVYFSVFCKYDFSLYNEKTPDQCLDDFQTSGYTFDNHSIAHPKAAPQLKIINRNGKQVTILNPKFRSGYNPKKGPKPAIVKPCSTKPSDKPRVSTIQKNEFDRFKLPSSQFIDLSKFKKLKSIGSGTYGNVYIVQEIGTDNKFAAKVAKTEEDLSNTYAAVNTVREVNILAQVFHPGLLRFVGYSPVDFSGAKFPTMVTELYSNGGLDKLLKQQVETGGKKVIPGWDNTKRLINAYGIASGLVYLHSNKIIHRDLKSANVLLDAALCPRIADFGFSKNYDPLTQSRMYDSMEIVGSPLYMAPELIEGADFPYSEKTDVYAFAFILYELFSTKLPYYEKNLKTQNQLFKIVREGQRPLFHDDLPTPLINLIENSWAELPEDRPTAAEICETLKGPILQSFEDVIESDFNDYVDFIQNYPTTFDTSKRLLHISDVLTSSSFQPVSFSRVTLYPYDKFEQLDPECQQLVRDAENDSEMQYLVGKYSVNAEKNFPFELQIGLSYLEKAAEAKNLHAVAYYCRILIKPINNLPNIDKAKGCLAQNLVSGDADVLFLYGLALKKEGNYLEAFHYFEEASKKGQNEAIYEMAKMYLRGHGTKKNRMKASKYLCLAKVNGHSKAESFSRKHKDDLEDDADDTEDSTSFGRTGPIKPPKPPSISDSFKGRTGPLPPIAPTPSPPPYIKPNPPPKPKKPIDPLPPPSDPKPKPSPISPRRKITPAKVEPVPSEPKPTPAAPKPHIPDPISDVASSLPVSVQHFNYVQHYAKSKDPQFTAKLAYLYENGVGCQINEAEAFKLYNESYLKGNRTCAYRLGMCYNKGIGTSIDYNKAYECFRASADTGYGLALYQCGKMMYKGRGISENKEASRTLFEEANTHGCNKGIAYLNNHTSKVSDSETISNLRQEANSGDADSAAELGDMYENGHEVTKNMKEAAKFYGIASNLGHPICSYRLAQLNLSGTGVPRNLEKALELFKLASDNNIKSATYEIGRFYEHGIVVDQNYDECVKHYQKAAMKKEFAAMTNLAVLYQVGKGVEQNYKEAFTLLKTAADKGYAHAIYLLGTCYQYGQGVEKDMSKAIELFIKASSNGDPHAAYQLSQCYLKGVGISKNESEANRYLNQASIQGHLLAQIDLSRS